MREEQIENMLTLVGADNSPSTVAMVDSIIDFIPTKYLLQFAKYVLKNYDKYKKPIVNLTTASQEFRKRLTLQRIANDEFTFASAQEVKEFLLEFFKGQEIANKVESLYQPFVTILLNEKGELINGFAQKRLDSLAANDFIFWCFTNQKRIGDVQFIETETANTMIAQNQRRIEQLSKEIGEQNNQQIDMAKTDKQVLRLINSTLKIA